MAGVEEVIVEPRAQGGAKLVMGAIVSEKWCAGKKTVLMRHRAGCAKPGDTSWTKACIGVVSIGHA